MAPLRFFHQRAVAFQGTQQPLLLLVLPPKLLEHCGDATSPPPAVGTSSMATSAASILASSTHGRCRRMMPFKHVGRRRHPQQCAGSCPAAPSTPVPGGLPRPLRRGAAGAPRRAAARPLREDGTMAPPSRARRRRRRGVGGSHRRQLRAKMGLPPGGSHSGNAQPPLPEHPSPSPRRGAL
jgi:hypothetical protein